MGRMFENRKHTMARRNSRDAKAFTRASREIAMAVRQGGPDPETNPSLRRAIRNARGVNMPNDNVKRAIDRASGAGAEDYSIVIYEGYGPHGVAVLVETATNNTTRTIANVRLGFKKGNGTIGTSGSVGFMFERQGVFKLDPEGLELEELELELIDSGLEELERETDENGNAVIVLRCGFTDFGTMQAALEAKGIEPKSSASEYVPTTTVELEDEPLEEVLKMIDLLEADDDVQNVYHSLA